MKAKFSELYPGIDAEFDRFGGAEFRGDFGAEAATEARIGVDTSIEIL